MPSINNLSQAALINRLAGSTRGTGVFANAAGVDKALGESAGLGEGVYYVPGMSTSKAALEARFAGTGVDASKLRGETRTAPGTVTSLVNAPDPDAAIAAANLDYAVKAADASRAVAAKLLSPIGAGVRQSIAKTGHLDVDKLAGAGEGSALPGFDRGLSRGDFESIGAFLRKAAKANPEPAPRVEEYPMPVSVINPVSAIMFGT